MKCLKNLFNDQRPYSILTPLNYKKRFCIEYKFDHIVSSYLLNVFNYISKTGFQEKFEFELTSIYPAFDDNWT